MYTTPPVASSMWLRHTAPMKAPIAALLCSLALITAAAAAPGTPITHELLWLMKRVGSPVVSPDGKWVVFPVLEPAYDPDQEISDLWLVPGDGSAPARRITNTRASERATAI